MFICSHKVNNKLLRVEFVTRNFLLAGKFYTVEVSKTSTKRSGKRNRDTFATVLFLLRSVTPVPRKLDQIILFLSLSHL